MKRRGVIAGMIVALLVLIGSGVFATTQLTDTSTVGITGGDMMGSFTASGYSFTKKPTGFLRGSVEAGELGLVTLDDDNTVDMMVVVSMVNAGTLDFVSLNLELAVFDNNDIRVGSIKGVNLWLHQTAFEVAYGVGWVSPYKVKVVGGSYFTWWGGGTLSPDLRVTLVEKGPQ